MKIVLFLLLISHNIFCGSFLHDNKNKEYESEDVKITEPEILFFNQPTPINYEITEDWFIIEEPINKTEQTEEYNRQHNYLDLFIDGKITTYKEIFAMVKEDFLTFSRHEWELSTLNISLEGIWPKSIYKIKDKAKKYIAKLIANINLQPSLFGLGYYPRDFNTLINKFNFKTLNKALREKTYNDFFYLLSNKGAFYITPKSQIAMLPVHDSHCKNHHLIQILSGLYNNDEIGRGLAADYEGLTNEGLVVEKAVRYMSEFVDGYMDLGDMYTIDQASNEPIFFMDYLKKYLRPPLTIINPHSAQLVKLKGLMHALAAGVMLADWDVLGGTGKNCGVIFVKNQEGEEEAICVKVDPGEAFYFLRAKYERPSNIDPKDIRYSLLAASENEIAKGDYSGYIRWDNLLAEQREEFIESILYAIKILMDVDEENNIVCGHINVSNKFTHLQNLMQAYFDCIFSDLIFSDIMAEADEHADCLDNEPFLLNIMMSIVEIFEVYTGEKLIIKSNYLPISPYSQWIEKEFKKERFNAPCNPAWIRAGKKDARK